MDLDQLIRGLQRFGDVLPAVVVGVSDQEARWKPPDGAWSILEITRHLADEEAEDFRPRIQSLLRDPAADWSPIDPVGWAVARNYNEGRIEDAAAEFARRRRESIAWLESVRHAFQPDLSKMHPKLGILRAGDLLAAWASHDALHLRQIAKRMHQIAVTAGRPYQADYAGDWGT